MVTRASLAVKTSVDSPKVLLIGCNRANNTGAEALVFSGIADLRAVLGDKAHLTVPTLNKANLRRYLGEELNLSVVPWSPIFLLPI